MFPRIPCGAQAPSRRPSATSPTCESSGWMKISSRVRVCVVPMLHKMPITRNPFTREAKRGTFLARSFSAKPITECSRVFPVVHRRHSGVDRQLDQLDVPPARPECPLRCVLVLAQFNKACFTDAPTSRRRVATQAHSHEGERVRGHPPQQRARLHAAQQHSNKRTFKRN